MIGDLDIGIKASLEKNSAIQIKALDVQGTISIALSEHVSGWPQKRGNGLPDVMRVVEAGKGLFMLYSDGTQYVKGISQEKWQKVEYRLPGVIVGVEISIHDFSVPRRGRPHGTVVALSQFGTQLSGREKGQEAYEVLVRELTALPKEGAFLIDTTGVIMMNTSFGDQAIGVLLENIKSGHFGTKNIYFTGEIKEVVDVCLDRISEIRDVKIVRV